MAKLPFPVKIHIYGEDMDGRYTLFEGLEVILNLEWGRKEHIKITWGTLKQHLVLPLAFF